MRTFSMHVMAVGAGIFFLCAAQVPAAGPAAAPAKENTKKQAKSAQAQKAPRPDSAVTAQPAAAHDTVAAKPDSAASKIVVTSTIALKIATTPDSASVYLDDSLRGTSPCSVNGLLPGPHVLTLKKKGFYLKKAEINLDTAASQELSFTLLRPAFLRVESAPAGADVSVDGKKEGISPWENDKVKPGDHLVMVELKDYLPLEKSLTLASNGRDTLRLTLDHSQAYKDSVAAVARAEQKSRRERFVFSLVSALFSICAITLVAFEASSGE